MSTVIVSLSLEIEEKAMRFPMDEVITRYAKDEGIPIAAAKEHERELKRYLILCSMNPHVRYGMKGPIDNLWHTFLIFTEQYAGFCSSIAGRFIHHVPATAAMPVSSSDYQRFLDDYELIFGEPAPTHLWPRLPALLSRDAEATADCSFGNCGPSCTPSCGKQGCGPGDGG